MFRYNVDIQEIEPERLGRYQCRYMIDIGTSKLYIANVVDESEIDRQEFKMVRWSETESILIPDQYEPDRKSFAFEMKYPNMILNCVSQDILAYRFAVTEHSVAIVGRAYPELYRDIDGAFIAVFEDPNTGERLMCTLRYNSDLGEFMVEQRDVTNERVQIRKDVRICSGDGQHFGTKASIGGHSIIYIHPNHPALARVSSQGEPLTSAINRLFRYGVSEDAAIVLEDDPNKIASDMQKIIDSPHIRKSDCFTRRVFIGYGHEKAVELRSLDLQIRGRSGELKRTEESKKRF